MREPSGETRPAQAVRPEAAHEPAPGTVVGGPRSVPESVPQGHQIEHACAALWADLERCPTDGELAEALTISVDALHAAYRRIAVEAPDVALALSAISSPEAADEVLAALVRLPEREKFILTLVHGEGLTVSEIGDVLGVSHDRVRQLHTKAVVQLRVARGLARG